MIHFDQMPEPPNFNQDCRLKGNEWLEQHPHSERPRDFWSTFKPQLADSFNQLCAYSAMYEPVGTVDHFQSCKHERHLAYEWSNYRFASGWINSSKLTADGTILDPFFVENGWFEIILPSLQLVVSNSVPAENREQAEFTLMRLHLRDDERVMRQRRAWYCLYENKELSLEGLRKMAPLIACAVEKKMATLLVPIVP